MKKQGHEVTNRKVLDEAAVQTRYEAHTQRHANDALQSLDKAIRKKAKELIDRIPDSTALPLLLWISHQYSLESIKSYGHIEPEPGWLNFGYVYNDNNEITPKIYYGYDREAVKHLLTECFNNSPSLFISNVSVLSRAFKNAINNKSKNNEQSRLKNFISCNLPDAESHTEALTATKNLINIYKNHYSKKSVPSQKGPLILTLLSAAHSDPKWQPDSLLGKWPTLLKYDADGLGKIGDNKLLQAAAEAFRKPFSTRSDIVMEIDHRTDYEYTDLTIRDKYYRRIKYHLKKHLPKNKDEAVNKTFTVSKYFFQQTKLKPELKSTENVKLAIAEALENIDKIKEAVANSDIHITSRSKPLRISSRLTEPTSNQLDSLAKKLKGEGCLSTNANSSAALEIAVLFKIHADSTRRKDTYPSHTRHNDAFKQLVHALEEEARPPVSLAETTESLTANHIPEKKLPIELNSNADQQKELSEPPQKDSPATEVGAPAAHENEVKDAGTPEEPDDQSSEPSANTEKHQPIPRDQLNPHSKLSQDAGEHQLEDSTAQLQQASTTEAAEMPKDVLKHGSELSKLTNEDQPESSLESSTAATATSTEAYEKPDAQLNIAEEHLALPANLLGMQSTTELAPIESNLPSQQASDTPPDGEREDNQENNAETQAADSATPEEEHSQGSLPTKVSEASQEDKTSTLTLPNGKKISVKIKRRYPSR
ncbi:hypothetical protein P6F15_07075 [Thiopseudomonas alkaliphila]|uniref:hypothetical protein n=1 Tax=Thiopseudomonas alkaliphila TaxID=1697053 RepID=UPI0035712648